jgi:hypothetical protein
MKSGILVSSFERRLKKKKKNKEKLDSRSTASSSGEVAERMRGVPERRPSKFLPVNSLYSLYIIVF